MKQKRNLSFENNGKYFWQIFWDIFDLICEENKNKEKKK